jgi:hypothetical protein
LPRRACRALSFELARLFASDLPAFFSLVGFGESNLCDDLEAIRFEKNDFEGSRPCFGEGREGEVGNSGTAVILGDVAPVAWVPWVAVIMTVWVGALKGLERL